MCPSLTGEIKLSASIEAVTHMDRQCLKAQMAAAVSIHAMIWPPKMVPRALVCSGKTSSVISTRDSEGGLGVIIINGRTKGRPYFLFFPKLRVNTIPKNHDSPFTFSDPLM